MSDPIVSVVIASYRRNDSLVQALESVANQSYTNFEIVLVDDNDDNKWNRIVLRIVEKFKNKYPQIKIQYVQNHPNQGSAQSRNRGIDLSIGKYITFLDDDDLYLENKIEHQVSIMESTQADYSLTHLGLYYEDGTLCKIRNREYLDTEEGKNLLLCHLKYHMTGTDTMMFKSEYIKSFGGFESIDVGDEYYLMMKAIENQGKFVYCECCDVKAYVHTGDGGLSSGEGKIKGENLLFDFKKKYFSQLRKKDVRYIKMRHHAVLAFAYKRCGDSFGFVKEGLMAGLASPAQCLKLLGNLK